MADPYEIEQRYAEALALARRLARIERPHWSPGSQDDLAQITVKRVWQRLGDTSWPDNAEAYLRVALRRNAVNVDDHERRRPEVAEGLAGTLEQLGAGDVEGWFDEIRMTPSRLVMQSMAVEAVLGLLGERDAELVRRRYLDNRRVVDIASEDGMHPDAVSRALRRATARLRQCLLEQPHVLAKLHSSGMP